jgi:hypothetical protein
MVAREKTALEAFSVTAAVWGASLTVACFAVWPLLGSRLICFPHLEGHARLVWAVGAALLLAAVATAVVALFDARQCGRASHPELGGVFVIAGTVAALAPFSGLFFSMLFGAPSHWTCEPAGLIGRVLPGLWTDLHVRFDFDNIPGDPPLLQWLDQHHLPPSFR